MSEGLGDQFGKTDGINAIHMSAEYDTSNSKSGCLSKKRAFDNPRLSPQLVISLPEPR